MDNLFLQARDGAFQLNGRRIILRGFSAGMDYENYMRMPGSEKAIRNAFSKVYGRDKYDRFFDELIECSIAEDDFKLLKSMGINTLRFTMDYRLFEDDQRPGRYKPGGFDKIDRALEFCSKYEIFAILDMHSSPGGQNPDPHGGSDTGTGMFWEDASMRERIINLWKQIAVKYKDERIIAGFDILNEPALIADAGAFNDFYENVINEIRSSDKNHIIFLEGDDWAKDFSIFKKLGGPQQAISFHFYPAMQLSMNLEPGLRKMELEKRLSYFTALRERTGMPLWAGETGGAFPGRFKEGMEMVREFLDLLEKYGISWTLWVYKDGGEHGLVYPKSTTKWMTMTGEFIHGWLGKGRSNAFMANEIFSFLEERLSYEIDNELKNRLKFRIFALLDLLHIDQLVIPRLKTITWEEMKEYPRSYLLENCDGVEEKAELVKSFTGINK